MIASKILEARARKGLSQGELAKRSGVYKSTIHRYEKGARPIRRNLEKLATALGVTIEYFLDESAVVHSEVSRLNLSEKMKKVIKFSPIEQKAVEHLIDQILEKRQMIERIAELGKLAAGADSKS